MCDVGGVCVQDTYDLKGYATAYGSWEYLDNIINDAESPLVAYLAFALHFHDTSFY